MKRNGSEQTQLTSEGGNDDFPHFQPVRKRRDLVGLSGTKLHQQSLSMKESRPQ
jgi:hypothetical protein